MKMNGDSFIMTAPHVILDTQIPFNQHFTNKKSITAISLFVKAAQHF